jgi:hypothetical protein
MMDLDLEFEKMMLTESLSVDAAYIGRLTAQGTPEAEAQAQEYIRTSNYVERRDRWRELRGW